MNKICPKCGKEVPDSLPKCPACGAEMNEIKVAPAETPAAPAAPTKVNFFAHVRKFKMGHIWALYFFKLLYVLGVFAMLGAVIMVPFITKDETATFNMWAFDFKFEGLTSIFSIVLEEFTTKQFSVGSINTLAPLVIYGLFLLPAVIWGIVKIIKAIINFIFFFSKRKMIVIEMLAKSQRKEYDMGFLNFDGFIWYSLFVTLLIYASSVIRIFVPAYNWHTFDVFETVQWQTFGSVCVAGGVVIALFFAFLYAIVRGVVRRKVRKHFGLIRIKKK